MKKKKKTTRKVSATKTTKKSVKKKTTPRPKSKAAGKTARKKATPKRKSSPSGNSVDSILKRFQKERSTQESLLASLRNKIEDLEARTEAYRQQILKLTEKEKSTKVTIEQLDSRRDAEVSSLLQKLGVQLNAADPEPVSAESESPADVSTAAEPAATDADDGGVNEPGAEADESKPEGESD